MEDLFDKYLENQMTATERSEFEQRLSEDVDLKTDFDNYSKEILGLKSFFLKSALGRIHDEISVSDQTAENIKQNPSSNKTNYYWILLLAALIIGGFVAYKLFFKKDEAVKQEMIFASLYEPYEGLPTPMSASENYDFLRGMVDYKTGDYQAAFDQWVKLSLKNDTIAFYTALAALEINKTDQAKSLLEPLLSSQSAYQQAASWYLALTALKNNETDQAIQKLKVISNDSTHPFAEKAVQALNSLNAAK